MRSQTSTWSLPAARLIDHMPHVPGGQELAAARPVAPSSAGESKGASSERPGVSGAPSRVQSLLPAVRSISECPSIGERLFSLMKFHDGQWSLAFGGREALERALLEHSDPGEALRAKAELAQLCAFLVGVPELRPIAVVILEVLESVKDRFTFIEAL